jgi:hypothetical protein
MASEVRSLLYLYNKGYIGELHFFNRLVDLAAFIDVERVMARVPPECRARFRDWIVHLPPLAQLINLKSGPLSEREKETIKAIREWFDRHPEWGESEVSPASLPGEPGDVGPVDSVENLGLPNPVNRA